MKNFDEAIEEMTIIVKLLEENGYFYMGGKGKDVIEFLKWCEEDRINLERVAYK